MTTLKVTVGERDRLDRKTERRIAAASAGEELADAQPVLNFETYAELSRLLSPTNMELLERIARDEPASISEAARLVDRDYKQVHRNLTELEDIGVIDLEGTGPGRPKTPTLAYDRLEIVVPFTETDGTPRTATS